MTQALLSGAAIGALYVLMSIGFALNLAIADIVNAAHGAFVVGGMYATLTLVQSGVPLYVSIALAGIIVGGITYPLYALFIKPARKELGHRVQLVYTMLMLSALTVIYQLVFSADVVSLGREPAAITIFGGYLTSAQIVAIVLAVVVAVALFVAARSTHWGKMASIGSRYPLGARSVGVPVERVHSGVFLLSSVLAGVSGGVLVSFQPVEPTLAAQLTVIVFLVALVAQNHLLGCLALGIGYGIVQSVLGYVMNSAYATVLTLLIFVVALVAEGVLRGAASVTARAFRPAVRRENA